MIDSVDIRNFRCHRRLELRDAARVNIVTGRNSSGKTSFLEAIFLALGPERPELASVINNLRRYPVTVDPEQHWGPLFHDFDCDQEIEIKLSREDGSHRLTIAPHKKDESQLVLPLSQETSGSSESSSESSSDEEEPRATWLTSRVLTWSYSGPNGAETVSRNAQVLQEGNHTTLKISPPSVSHPRKAILISDPAGLSGAETAERFMNAKAHVSEGVAAIIDTLRIVEPKLVDVYPLPVGGSSWFLHLRLKGLDHVVPISFAGSGVNLIMNLLPSIVSVREGGVVLCDELERGLHYSAMKPVFKALCSACKVFGVQVFIATHSKEFLQAAAEAVEDDASLDVKVFRLDRSNQHTECFAYDRRKLLLAMEKGMELR